MWVAITLIALLTASITYLLVRWEPKRRGLHPFLADDDFHQPKRGKGTHPSIFSGHKSWYEDEEMLPVDREVLRYLAGREGKNTNYRQIARAVRISPDYVKLILHRLRERNILTAYKHGNKGNTYEVNGA